MKKFFASIQLHLFFITLTQILYATIYLLRPEVLGSYWLYFYNGICIFIYLATGWIVSYELRNNWLAIVGGFLVFLVGFLVQLIGVFYIVPYLNPQRAFINNTMVLKFMHYELYYAGIAIVLAIIGARLCTQYRRHQDKKTSS